MREEDCKFLNKMFRDKFGVLPHISYVDTFGWGKQFCIYKTPTYTEGMILYLKMGFTMQQAKEYIERLIFVPSAIITFNNDKDRSTWAKEEMLRTYQIEMNRVCANQFETENI